MTPSFCRAREGDVFEEYDQGKKERKKEKENEMLWIGDGS
jgi:hypothetical protein